MSVVRARAGRGVLWGVWLSLSLAVPGARAADPKDTEVDVPSIRPRRGEPSEGKVIRRIEVKSADPRWDIPRVPLGVSEGEVFTPGIGRKAARELSSAGAVAEITIETEPEGDGVLLRLVAMPQRAVRAVQVQSEIDVKETLRAAGLEAGRPVTPPALRAAEQAVLAKARARGYPAARVQVTTRATDAPLTVVVLVELITGAPRTLSGVRTEVHAATMPPGLRDLLASYPVRAGDRADDGELAERGRALQARLQGGGFHLAQISHRLYEIGDATYLLLKVEPGPLFRTRYEGNLNLDAEHLDGVVDFEKDQDRSVSRAVQKIREEYQRLGFLDVEVSGAERASPGDAIHDLVFTIREHQRARVVARRYPCLPTPGEGDVKRGPRELDRELDSFLEEELPGATLLSAISPKLLDQALGLKGPTGARPAPLSLDPREVFVEDVYDRALRHMQNLYRSEGYLAAAVGPVQLVRRRCSPSSPPGQCVPMPAPPSAAERCLVDIHKVPVEEPPIGAEQICRPDPRKGIECSPDLEVRIPVKPGPRAVINDVIIDGAEAFAETKLLEVSKIKPGEWASNTRLEEARRALLDHYKENGYAYAEVNASFELSPDKKLARVRFALIERQQVRIERILIQGNTRTAEGVIRARLRIAPDGIFQQSAVRRSEELLATLGVFSTVSIGLEDPAVPSTRKNVIVQVVERSTQYLEMRPGFSTGEGVRGLLEYGNRNLGGLAIQVTLRVQLSYLFDALIPDDRVRANFDSLPLLDRLERRNSVSFQFPNVFHASVRLGVDAVDVRSNSRDFGLTRQALLPALTFSPFRQLSTTLGASAELNNVDIFSGDTVLKYLQQPGVTNDLSRLLRVPDGETIALGQRLSAVWDRRDNPLGATQGTLVAGSIEHVYAFPADSNPNTTTSNFLRMNGRVGAYVRLSDNGLAFAAIAAAGYNHQLLSDSKTYPDRLFFLGGVDSLRGFLRDSLVPQDIADQIAEDSAKPASDTSRLTIDKVAIRGGDLFFNPRVELRIPLSGPLETTLFIDSGNVWVDPRRADPFNLRYTGGSGLRFATPIGPVAMDYGLNLRRRSWEDFGAFHFSIGLF